MRQYPFIYSQRDSAWASQQLGSVAGATIGQYGCILTCHAMKAGYYGHEIKPNALNDIYKQRNLYVSGDLLSDADLHAVFDDIQLIDTRNYQDVPADLNYLKQLAADNTITVTLELDFDHDPNDGIQTHFVELHDFDGTNLTIYDPWYGTDDNFTLHYGTNLAQTIQKFAVYKGSPQQPGTYVDAGTFNKLVHNSGAYDSVCDNLGINRDSDGSIIIAAIAQLKKDKTTAEQTITVLNQQLPDLKTKNDTLVGQIKILQQQLQDAQNAANHPDAGSSYKDLYNQAEIDLIKVRSDLAQSETTNKKQMAQYQNTSYFLVGSGTIIQEAIKRILHLK